MNLPESDGTAFDFGSLRQLLTRYAAERTPPNGRPNTAGEDPFEFRVSPHCFPGLRSFNPAEERFFFGRQKNITEIRKELAAERIVVVQGGSGTGKSSVIRAGLIPRLRDTGAIQGRRGNWYSAEFRPRMDPIGNLADGLGELIARAFPDEPAANDASRVLGTETTSDADQGGFSRSASISKRLKARFNQAVEGSGDDAAPEVRRTTQAAALLQVLGDVTAEIDRLDKSATRGLRAGPANLLLLIDQFEEVFRPETAASGKYLLDLLIAAYSFLTQTLEGQTSGLFIVVTMRTEELHRVGEYPALTLPTDQIVGNRRTLSLADVVNTSFYLIQVMDPDQDREELREAIVAPPREVLGEYGLLRGDSPDAPFDNGVVDWLLNGAKVWRDSAGQNRKADQLPLLQHALRAMWESALDRWGKAIAGGEGEPPMLLIGKQDLPQPDAPSPAADLAYCLDFRADQAKENAKRAFDEEVLRQIDEPRSASTAGEAALRAAFRALARRDDRGNWARRFASIELMDDFMAVDPATASLETEKRRAGLVRALGVLIAEGYMSRDNAGDFDISHEALIRNWRTAGAWLREASDTASAIERVLQDVDPSLIGVADKAGEIEELIPRQVAERLAPIAGPASSYEIGSENQAIIGLPIQWSKEQIRLLIGTNEFRKGWGSEDEALAKVQIARKQANEERHRQNTRQQWTERIKWGAPILVLGLVAFLIFLSNAYSAAEDAVLGAWATSVVGWATSDQSLADDNSIRAYDIEQVSDKLLHPQISYSAWSDMLLKQALEQWDYGVRLTLGASLTFTDVRSEQATNNVVCWSKGNAPVSNRLTITIGPQHIPANLILKDGTAHIVRDRPSIDGQEFVTWDADQLSFAQHVDKSPEHTRFCMSDDASTLIVATPGSPLQAFSLLWQAKTSDTFNLRGWLIFQRSGPPPSSLLACVRGIDELREGTAVITKILYDLTSVGEKCEPTKGRQHVAAFVRGLLAPVELSSEHLLPPQLSSEREQATRFFNCIVVEKKEHDNEIWSCDTNFPARRIGVTITLPRSDRNQPNLALSDPGENEMSGGPIVIDEAIMPTDANNVRMFPEKMQIACYDKSISVLITTRQGGEDRTWAYVMGTEAMRKFLAHMAAQYPRLQAKDPTNLLNEQGSDWLLKCPSWAFHAVLNIFKEFRGSPPSLCS